MKRLKHILGGIIISMLTACSGTPHQEKINSLDSMKVELEQAGQEFLKLDTNDIMQRYDTIARYLQLIRQSLKDTLTRDQAYFLSDYYEVRKPYRAFNVSHRMLTAELEYTKSQLDDLSRALENSDIPDEKVDEYFDLEFSSAQSLHNTIISKIEQLNDADAQFDTLHPMVEQFVNEAAVKHSGNP